MRDERKTLRRSIKRNKKLSHRNNVLAPNDALSLASLSTTIFRVTNGIRKQKSVGEGNNPGTCSYVLCRLHLRLCVLHRLNLELDIEEGMKSRNNSNEKVNDTCSAEIAISTGRSRSIALKMQKAIYGNASVKGHSIVYAHIYLKLTAESRRIQCQEVEMYVKGHLFQRKTKT